MQEENIEKVEKVEDKNEKPKVPRIAVELEEDKFIKFKIKTTENRRNMADVLREYIEKYISE